MAKLKEQISILSSPSGEKVNPTLDYHLPERGKQRLSALVKEFKRSPMMSQMITAGEMSELAEKIDTRNIINNLPMGIPPEDYYGINSLSLLTESATLTYTDQFVTTARASGQPWLEEFIEDVWTPDELTHHLPFKHIALDLGASEEEINREIVEAQEREFIHGKNYTPGHIVPFGAVQEYLTMRWYQLTQRILPKGSPEAYMVNRVQQREAWHMRLYRDMAAIQIEENPALVKQMAETYVRFKMPGNEIAPRFQEHAHDWMFAMGEELDMVKKDLLKLNDQMLHGNPEFAGRLLVEMADLQGKEIGPFSIHHLNIALNRLGRVGGAGYGLIGEAVMEKMGFRSFFTEEASIPARLRNVLRTAVANRIPFN